MFKIYVGNLDPRVKIEQVREIFSSLVTIEDAVLVADDKSGKPKGFAIIMVRDAEIGRAAVKATQGRRLLGKTLTINEVMKKGQAAAKAAKETRQGPFGPHFNRQGGSSRTGGGLRSSAAGGARRGFNRGPRGASGASGASGLGSSGPLGSSGGTPGFGSSGGLGSPPSSGGSSYGNRGGFRDSSRPSSAGSGGSRFSSGNTGPRGPRPPEGGSSGSPSSPRRDSDAPRRADGPDTEAASGSAG